MNRLVSFVVMGKDFQMEVGNANSDEEAREKIAANVAKTFHINTITPVAPRKRTKFWSAIATAINSILPTKWH